MWFGVDPRMDTKKTRLKDFGLHAQNTQTIHSKLNSQHNWGRDLYDHLMSTGIFTSYDFQKLLGKWLRSQFGYANHLITCFIS